MKVSLKRIRRIADDIKRDKDWVNDSHTYHEYKGMCYGIDRIINHLEEIDEYNRSKLKKQTQYNEQLERKLLFTTNKEKL